MKETHKIVWCTDHIRAYEQVPQWKIDVAHRIVSMALRRQWGFAYNQVVPDAFHRNDEVAALRTLMKNNFNHLHNSLRLLSKQNILRTYSIDGYGNLSVEWFDYDEVTVENTSVTPTKGRFVNLRSDIPMKKAKKQQAWEYQNDRSSCITQKVDKMNKIRENQQRLERIAELAEERELKAIEDKKWRRLTR